MKKSVVILIAIIYVASIALVSFFGLKAKVFNEVVYTTGIEILNEDVLTSQNGQKYVTISPNEKGERTYQILYRVSPDNATNSEVSLDYDTQNPNVTVSEDGLVTFSKGGTSVTIQINAKDGSGASASIKIIAK